MVDTNFLRLSSVNRTQGHTHLGTPDKCKFHQETEDYAQIVEYGEKSPPPQPLLKYIGGRALSIKAVLFEWCITSGNSHGLIAVAVITRTIKFKIS